ncbi:NAD(P)-dependent oxidoreductase [Pelagibius litoralis]|uniref:L-threonate dehydrogenase n=1 Tax=Pelagibius litoralis TaxID=374515 RepID=A0A967F0N3_9PROT|nr:L-threonate dehydrogenase [Pelagibius litoralis]NIA70946.1 NAD(P)-dependent oxidoreductase [Pelagibius litoralis]
MAKTRVGVIGLGSMGFGMAVSAQKAGLEVVGFDLAAERRDALVAEGGSVAASLRELAGGVDVLVSVVVNAAQTEAVLFGPDGVAEVMPEGAVFVSCATVAPKFAGEAAARLEAGGRHYLDAPMSGGAVGANAGALTFMASGSAAAFERADPALQAMGKKIYRLGDTAGRGSSMKLINQLLVGIHIAAAGEAMAMAVKLGLDPEEVYEVISNSAGASWAFCDRVPSMLTGDYSPKSAVSIFTKDLGIVLDTARAEGFPVPLAGNALQSYLMAEAAGMAGDNDSSVVRVYAKLAELDLPGG